MVHHEKTSLNPDTIVALATPPGRGGIGIIRISGNKVNEIASSILSELPKPRRATHTPFLSAEKTVIDEGIALLFPKPNSFTGEDVLELQGHGSPRVAQSLIKRILELGAR